MNGNKSPTTLVVYSEFFCLSGIKWIELLFEAHSQDWPVIN